LPSLLRFRDRLFYGWVVVVSFLIIGTVLWGVRLSFGVFFKSLESEFNLTRAETSAILSVYMVLGIIFAVIGGRAIDRYGPKTVVLLMGIFTGLGLVFTSQVNSLWQLFITYSLLLSIGTSATFLVVVSTVARWFDKKRGLAVGIATSGIGLGMVVVTPFANYLINIFDWRTAYLVLGITVWLVVIPLSRLLRKDPYEIGTLPDGLELDLTDVKIETARIKPTYFSLLQAVRTRSFWLIMFIWLLFATNAFILLTHLVPHAMDIGFSSVEAAIIISLIGAGVILGRILLGAVADRLGRKSTTLICAILQGGAMLWLSWSNHLWMLYLFALIYGFVFGGMGSSVAALIADTFGLGNIGTIVGVLEIGFGIGAAIGPIIGGIIFDISNSYFMAFLSGAIAMFVIVFLISLIRRETEINSGVR